MVQPQITVKKYTVSNIEPKVKDKALLLPGLIYNFLRTNLFFHNPN